MANISLTSLCNRACSYCFAAAWRRTGTSCMSRETFSKILDFLAISGIGQARLLGGEPTLHPEFTHLADLALERGFRVLVFSNGHIGEAELRWIEAQSPARFAVLINAEDGDRVQAETLRRFGTRATLGFNIHSPRFDLAFLINAIHEHGLSPSIRLGLAHPSHGDGNRYLHPRYYADVGAQLARFARHARQFGIALSLDCGFVPCMFPSGALEQMGAGVGECCAIPDILPDGQMTPCYPLSSLYRIRLTDGMDASQVRSAFAARFAGPRQIGVFSDCGACEVRLSGRCSGGCLAAALNRFQSPDSGEPLPQVCSSRVSPEVEPDR